jgi:hypothetical protein
MNEQDKLAILKELLLTDEHEYAKSIEKKLEKLQAVVEQKDQLSIKVDPIIDEKLEEFIENIPKTLGPTITEALKKEIANSQDAVVEALYPIMGKMIKRYIQNEIALLTEKINKQIEDKYSFKAFKRRLFSKSSGIDEASLMLSDQGRPKIQQIFVIEKNSGIIISSLTKTDTIDQDMVAGMLTAIKSFVEDAFKAGEQELQTIEYDLYTIHVQNFANYYMAVVLSGVIDKTHRSKLEDLLLNFAQYKINKTDLNNPQQFSDKLKLHFKNDSF